MLSTLTQHSLGCVPMLLPYLVLTFWLQMHQCHPVKLGTPAELLDPVIFPRAGQSGAVVTRINSAPGPKRTFFHTPEMRLSVSLQVEKATCVNWKSCGVRFHLEPSLGVLTPQGLGAKGFCLNSHLVRQAEAPTCLRWAHTYLLGS